MKRLTCVFLFLLVVSTAYAQPKPGDEALDRALQSAEQPKDSLLSAPLGDQARLRLLNIALIGLFAVGGSTEPDDSLETLQAGEHDPTVRGFNVQQGEFSISGAIDPYFTAQSNIVLNINENTGDTEVELEELFFNTTCLPYGLELKGGYFLTEFGRMNSTHPHTWEWLDQPVINSRIFGGDGTRGAGARLAWLLPLPFYLQVMGGVQNAHGATMPSFLDSGYPIGGRPGFDRQVNGLEDFAYFGRIESAVDLGSNLASKVGTSFMWGPNTTADDGQTLIAGADLYAQYRFSNHFRGYPFISFQSEFLYRHYRQDNFYFIGDPMVSSDDVFYPRATLQDYGFYAQMLYGFHYGWEAGVRYEFATGSGESVNGRSNDPFRDNRHRVSPLIAWRLSEFARIRLQGNYDRTSHLFHDDAVSVWAGFDFLIGTHPAHRF